jgi:hypothetical protein
MMPDCEIKIYATGGNVRPLISHINHRLASDGLRLELVPTPEIADVRVSIVKVPGGHLKYDGRPECEGTCLPWLGRIQIAPNASAMTLLHEILHCAGIAHEDDPLSVMYPTSSYAAFRIKPEHIKALRKLPGITTFGRLIAQIRS